MYKGGERMMMELPRDEIFSLYDTGLSAKEVADQLDLDYRQVYYVLRNSGVLDTAAKKTDWQRTYGAQWEAMRRLFVL